MLKKRFDSLYFSHICLQLAFFVVMMGLFCRYQNLSFPAKYMCPVTNATITSFNQVVVNITCNDLQYKKRSIVNIAIIVIMAVSIPLWLLTIIHYARNKEERLSDLLLGNLDEDHNSEGGERFEGK